MQSTIKFVLASIALSVMVLILSCGSRNEDIAGSPGDSLPNDFYAFYEQFHADTGFQASHITFPLQGLRAFSTIDSTVENRPWTKDEWVYHTRIDQGKGYNVTFDILSDEFIAETIVDSSGTYAMQRRFALTSDGWKLIYYVEMQPASPQVN